MRMRYARTQSWQTKTFLLYTGISEGHDEHDYSNHLIILISCVLRADNILFMECKN